MWEQSREFADRMEIIRPCTVGDCVDYSFEYRLGLHPLYSRAFPFCTTLAPAQSTWPLSLGRASPQQTSAPSESFCQLTPLHRPVTVGIMLWC